ncbi:MAG: bile acid:sodium symporter [Pseudomonadota bacterium]
MEAYINTALVVSMFTIMAALGLGLTLRDFQRALNKPLTILAALTTLSVILPLIGFFLGWFFTEEPAVAVGLMLVGACPGGMLSNAYTSYAKGNVALSISLTLVVSLAAVVVLPLVSSVAASAFLTDYRSVTVPIVDTLIQVFMLSAVPVIFGMTVNRFFPAFSARIRDRAKDIAALVLISVFVFYGDAGAPDLEGHLTEVFVLVGVLNAASIVIGFMVTRLLGLNREESVAYVMEHSVKQEGLGLYIAATVLALPAATIPLLFNSFIGFAFGTALIFVCRGWAARTIPGDAMINL